MSSCGNPATEVAALMPRRLKFDKSQCVKCKGTSANIVIRHAVYCKHCFLAVTITKFKRILEPSVNPTLDKPRRKALKASGNLLLAFSGGLGSTVLLNLVSQCYFKSAVAEDENPRGGKNHPRNGNVWKKVAVCYVEVCNAFPGTRDRTDDVRAVVEHYPEFEFIPLRIEDAFDKLWWGKVGGSTRLHLGFNIAAEDVLLSSISPTSTDVSPIALLQSYMLSLPTYTATMSSIQTLTRLLLLYTASSIKCSHLLLGTSLTTLSIALISSISQGGGFTVSEEIEEEWMPSASIKNDIGQRLEDSSRGKRCVRVIRPLRDIGIKECAVWAWWVELRVVGREKLPGTDQGIGGLTKDFIVGLEQDYPSTVSAIARTCGKLAPKETARGDCALCGRPLQPGVQDWKARISIRSLSDSEPMSAHVIIPQPTSAQEGGGIPDSQLQPLSFLTSHLCYACHTTLTSRSSRGVSSRPPGTRHHGGDTSALPVWVESCLLGSLPDSGEPGGFAVDKILDDSEVGDYKKMGATEMKSMVAGFLLE